MARRELFFIFDFPRFRLSFWRLPREPGNEEMKLLFSILPASSSSSDAADAAFDVAQEHEGGLEEKKRRGRLREKLSR